MTKMWDSMNSLEMLMCKVCSAREIITSAIDAIGSNQKDKAENLMSAAYDFLGYYIEEFDKEFKVAWQETVCKQPIINETNNEQTKWYIDVEEAYDKNGDSIFSYIQLPESLIKRMNLTPESRISWIPNSDGTVVMKLADSL